MKGNITMLKTFRGEDEILFSESNLVVDGGRAQIVDMLTHIPNTSATSVPAYDMVSGYQHQAMTLSPAKDYYDQKDCNFFIASALTETSGTAWTLVPPSETNYPCVNNQVSSARFNQFQYIGTKDFDLSDWQKDSFFGGKFSTKEVAFSTKTRTAHRFEYERGDSRVVLRKKMNLKLGNEYTLQYEGKASDGIFSTFRIGRGTADRAIEYYNFSTQKFSEAGLAKEIPGHDISFPHYFDSEQFSFVLKGNEIDQPLEKYTTYFVELVVPSYRYEQAEFAPYVEQENPFLEIVRLELLSGEDYILRNPNFLETQSKFSNNEFKFFDYYKKGEVLNPTECAELGIVKFAAWETESPLALRESPQDDKLKYGYVRSFDTDYATQAEGAAFSALVGEEGVALFVSSNNPNENGYAELSQQRYINVDNEWAHPDVDLTQNIDEAYGLEDRNKTFLLTFDVLPTGTGTAGNVDVVVTRLGDGATYKTDTETNARTHYWDQLKLRKNSFAVTKNEWNKISLPVVFDAESRGQYEVKILAQGRDGVDGFITYHIKDFCFGDLVNWDIFPVGFSDVGTINWTGSSMSFGGEVFNTNASYNLFSGTLENPKRAKRKQLVTKLKGLQPQKAYNLATRFDNSSDTEIEVSLKAWGREKRNRNLASNWRGWTTGSLSALPPSQANVFFSGQPSHGTHVYYPKQVRALEDPFTKPADTCIHLKPLNSSPFNSIGYSEFVEDVFMVNDGDNCKVSIEVAQRETDASGYLHVVINPQNAAVDQSYVWNWVESKWDTFTFGSNSDARFGNNNSTSSLYYKPFQGNTREEFTKIEFGYIPFRSKDLGRTTKWDRNNETFGIGNYGDYMLLVDVFGPLNGSKGVYVRDLRFEVNRPYNTLTDAYRQLYYDFDLHQWTPGHKTHTMSPTQTSLTIENMHLHGLGEDTVYQLNIVDSSGGTFNLKDVSIADISYAGSEGAEGYQRDKTLFTSEPWTRHDYAAHKGFIVRQEDGECLSHTTADFYLSALNAKGTLGYFSIPLVGGEKLDGLTAADADNDVLSTSGYLGARKSHQPVMTFNFSPAEYGLKGGDKVTLQYTTALKTAAPQTVNAFFVALARSNGQIYSYSPEKDTWYKGFNFRTAATTVRHQPSQDLDVFQGDPYNFQYKRQTFKIPSLPEDCTVTVGLYFRGIDGTTPCDALIKELHLLKTFEKGDNYRVSGDSFLFPEFPTPEDDFVQSRGGVDEADELGHLMNRLNFFSTSGGDVGVVLLNGPTNPSDSGEKSYFEAVNQGGYLPSAGMYFASGAFGVDTSSYASSVLNGFAVVNHDGFILKHPKLTPLDATLTESRAGFVTSSVSIAGTQTPTVRYILRVYKDDWKFIDYYNGGVGAFGLWSFDREKSIKKGLTLDFYDYTSDALTAAAGSAPVALYNHSYENQPEFKLNAKKAVFPPGLHIDYATTDYLTIIWDIQY